MCEYRELECNIPLADRFKMQSYLESKGVSFRSLSSENRIKLVNSLEMACNRCSLRQNHCGTVPSVLREDSTICFIGRNPNKSECRDGVLFSSGTPQGEIFKSYLEFLGVGMSQCSMVNMCSCGSKNNSPVTSDQIAKCSILTSMALQSLPKVRIVFPMCRDAISWMFGTDELTSLVGNVYKSSLYGKDILVIPIYHPSQCLCDKEIAHLMKDLLMNVRTILQM